MSKFDPTNAVTFDVAHGTVKTGKTGEEHRVVLVPKGALGDVIDSVGDVGARALGNAIGRAAGEHMLETMGSVQKIREAALDVVITQLAGELSIRGVGLVTMERWGRAMIVAIESPISTSGEFLAGLIETAFASSTGRDLKTVCLDRGSPARILLANQAVVTKAKSLLGDGVDFNTLVSRLQEGN
jgi:hypothetical protein